MIRSAIRTLNLTMDINDAISLRLAGGERDVIPKVVRDAVHLGVRYLTHLVRQPWYLMSALGVPAVWLLLYSQLLRAITEIPRFGADTYITFLVPGVVTMTGLFTGGSHALSQLREMHAGTLNKLIVLPVAPLAIIGGRALAIAALTVVQTLLLIALGWLAGARFGGLTEIAVLLLCTLLLSTSMGIVWSTTAIVIGRDETVAGLNHLVLQILTLTAPVFIAPAVMPAWMRAVTRFNPVSWATEATRAAARQDFGGMWLRLALLALLLLAAVQIGQRGLRAYRRSL